MKVYEPEVYRNDEGYALAHYGTEVMPDENSKARRRTIIALWCAGALVATVSTATAMLFADTLSRRPDLFKIESPDAISNARPHLHQQP